MGTFLDRVMLLWPGADPAVLAVITVIAVALAGFVLGYIVKGLRSRAPTPSFREVLTAEVAPPEDSTSAALEESRREVERGKALLAFSQELVGATSVGQLRTAIACHLPPMLGTRRVWVSSQIRGRRHVMVVNAPEGGTRELLDTSGQEWTTFPLRVERDVVGLLGVESAGGLDSHLKQFVQQAAPFVAQALNTADQFETLRETSLVDLLTGTATRREGLTRLGAEIKRAQRTGSAMAVLMLDLDRFKSINDRFGHAVGDAVLMEVGRTLQRTLRASDSRCRWGGEEFLIVLPDTDLTRAQIVANGLLRNVAAATVPTAVGPVGCTASIGLTITRPGETQIEAIVRRADIALYRAKEAGRSCVRVVLGDRDGRPIGLRHDDGPQPPPKSPPTPPATPRTTPLPFPDRRNPLRRDRRSIPSPGRRSTDPQPHSREARDSRDAASTAVDNRVRTNLR